MLIPFGVFSAAGAGATSSYELIATTAGNGSSNIVSFTSIPQGYKHLQVRMVARTTDTYNGGTYGTMFFNDAATTYNSHYLYGAGTSVTSGYNTGNIYLERFTTNGDTSGVHGAMILDLLDYTNTNKYKTVRFLGGYNGSGARQMQMSSGLWQSTSAITKIDIYSPTSGIYWTTTSRFSLYGIRG